MVLRRRSRRSILRRLRAACRDWCGRRRRIASGRSEREPRSLAGKGIAALLAGDAPSAKLLLEQAVRILPDDTQMLQALGWAQILSQDGAAAESTFARLGAQPGSSHEANGGLAVARAMRGRRGEAAQALAHLDPQDPAAQMAKAMLDGDPQALAQLREVAARALRR